MPSNQTRQYTSAIQSNKAVHKCYPIKQGGTQVPSNQTRQYTSAIQSNKAVHKCHPSNKAVHKCHPSNKAVHKCHPIKQGSTQVPSNQTRQYTAQCEYTKGLCLVLTFPLQDRSILRAQMTKGTHYVSGASLFISARKMLRSCEG